MSSVEPVATGAARRSVLEAAVARGRDLWPSVDVPSDRFVAHVEGIGALTDDVARHGSDLYLACGCAGRDRHALRALEYQLLPSVRESLTRLRVSAMRRDEALQDLRIHIVGDGHISAYAGRGPLLAWLRGVAMRMAWRSQGHPQEQPLEDSMHDGLVAAEDPELHAVKTRYRELFQRALDDSLAALSPRAKTLIRMFYLDRLNIDAIAVVYHVHRATVARWLAAIRATVLSSIRERLWLPDPSASSDFRALATALRDELHISIERVLDT